MQTADGIQYQLLHQLAEYPTTSQRELARQLGVSVGKVNYCLHALMERGLVKAGNFCRSDQKMHYAYVLTPEGIREKAVLGRQFLARKMAEYDALAAQIVQLRDEIGASGP